MRKCLAVGILTPLVLVTAACDTVSDNPEEEKLATSLENVYIDEDPTTSFGAWGLAQGGAYVAYAGDSGWPEESVDIPVCWSDSPERALELLEIYVETGTDASAEDSADVCTTRKVDPAGYAKLE